MLANKIVRPIRGKYFSHESCHNGGVEAFATSLPLAVFVGTQISDDSGVMTAGQIMDQSIELAGRLLRSRMFWPCAR